MDGRFSCLPGWLVGGSYNGPDSTELSALLLEAKEPLLEEEAGWLAGWLSSSASTVSGKWALSPETAAAAVVVADGSDS